MFSKAGLQLRNLNGFFVALAAVALGYVLYSLRSLDDNTLTSWRWVLGPVDSKTFVVILLMGVSPAYALSRFKIEEKGPEKTILPAAFLISALLWGIPEVIVDSSRYFTQAKHLEVYGIGHFFGEWGRGISAWTDMPAVPFLYGMVFKIFGESRVFVQALVSVLFSLTVFFTYKTGEALWGHERGFFAGALLLGMPYLFVQVPLLLVDVPAMFFLIFSVYLFIKALREGRAGWILASSALIFVTFFVKYSTWLMLSVLLPVFFCYVKDAPASVSRRAALVLVISWTLIGAAFLMKQEVFFEQMRLLVEFQRPGLGTWQESFVSTFLFQMHPFVALLAAASVFAALKRRDPKYLVAAWLPALVLILGIRRIRYIVMAFPFFALTASYGLSVFGDKGLKRLIVLCAAMVSVSTVLLLYKPFLMKVSTVNMKEAGRFLDSLDVEYAEVFALPQRNVPAETSVSVPILDLFTKKRILYSHVPDETRPRDVIEKSPMRFTWEFKNPDYYAEGGMPSEGPRAVVVISDGPVGRGELPVRISGAAEGLGNSRLFDSYEGVFRFRTSVEVYY